ncbi:tetratricopeptide repeat protein [Chryseobacterium sp. EO14]|uniref:tetratricopeptide repeat protein n=1 Tax=Chryseobacterium sp. EO14 TaxID=2950551 RepID=UPI0021098EBD|nr:tetratricopeptide repeat protein [Chryseobacterium sp. EO14]MCQ4142654.1 tetratricopeptide repeat protein [Chryseobacterium sp. EO14]
MKTFFKILLVLIFAQQFSAQNSTAKTAEEWYNLGEEKYKAKNYEKAIPFLKKSVELDNRYHYALNELGLCYFYLKNYTKAKEYFRLAILYSDKNVVYYSNLAAVFSNLGEDEKAYDYARKALEIEENSQTLFNAASMANNAEKPEECLKIMDGAKIEKENHFLDLYGRCYYKIKDCENSIKSLEEFLNKYDASNDDIGFDIESDQSLLLYSYGFAIGDKKIDENSRNIYIGKFTQDLKKHSREELQESFFYEDNLCNKYEFSSGVCTKIFNSLFSEISLIEKVQFQYYSLRDFNSSFNLSTQLLSEKENNNEDVYQIKLYQYLSSLNLYLLEYQKNNDLNIETFESTVELFKNMYEKNREYTIEEFKKDEKLQQPMVKTIEVFKVYFPGSAYDEKIKPLIKKIVENIPVLLI